MQQSIIDNFTSNSNDKQLWPLSNMYYALGSVLSTLQPIIINPDIRALHVLAQFVSS